MTAVSPRFVTPAEVCGLLESFCPIAGEPSRTGGTVTPFPVWSASPSARAAGQGRCTAGPSSEILVQVATLKFAQDISAQRAVDEAGRMVLRIRLPARRDASGLEVVVPAWRGGGPGPTPGLARYQ